MRRRRRRGKGSPNGSNGPDCIRTAFELHSKSAQFESESNRIEAQQRGDERHPGDQAGRQYTELDAQSRSKLRPNAPSWMHAGENGSMTSQS